MSQSLYRKYRSRTFDELVGQEHVTRTLTNAVASGKIAHAYLFCGPRGTGKTSTARLLAKAVNCTFDGPRPCNECAACTSINRGQAMDLIEIDAASRRKVEDVAEIIERVNFAPAELRYKVYIIDEVHMLTAHAFNALLKTLEEPPESAIFMLATTEVWKVLPTIISRCQRFDFRRIPAAEVVARLEHVAAAEGLRVQPQALAAIARLSTGSLRDALGLLDQLTIYGDDEITLDRLQQLLGTVGSRRVAEFVDSLADRDAAKGLAQLSRWREDGMDARQFTQELVEYLRNVLLVKVSDGATVDLTHEALDDLRAQAARLDLHYVLDATERFSGLDYTLRTGPYGYLPLELALVAATSGTAPAAREAADEAVARPNPARAAASSSPARQSEPGQAPARRNPAYADAAPTRTQAPAVGPGRPAAAVEPGPAEVAPLPHDGPLDLAAVQAAWPRVLDVLKVTNRTLQALLRESEPVSLEGNRIELRIKYEFHKTKIEEEANRALIEQTVGKVLAQPATIVCTLGDGSGGGASRPSPTRDRDEVYSDPRTKAALNIFNGTVTEINGG